MNRSVFFPLLWLVFLATGVLAQNGKQNGPEFTGISNRWIDSVFNSLDQDQRIAQLFMVAAYSNRDLRHVKEIRELIETYNIGGLIWMQGSPLRQGKLANYFQGLAQTPLLYGIDAEWGLSMRLDSAMRYPRQMTLGAISDDSLVYRMGRQIGRECRRLGIHVNFAPVADVNNNPLNPVIGVRSFGEDKYNVSKKAFMYMKGLQDEHVLANAKHFPGHGDTDSDSHHALPLIPFPRERIDSLELFPFRYLFERGLGSVMVAHLNIPAFDSTPGLPSTLSPRIVNELLKQQLGFKGLVFTDALNMKGVSRYFKPGIADVRALLAGNDVLLFSGDVPKAISEIKRAISDGRIRQSEIDEKCKRIIQAKYWCGLHLKPEIVTRNIHAELNSREGSMLNDELAASALTLLRNQNGFLPLQGTDTTRIAAVSIGVEENNSLVATLRSYAYVEHVGLTHTATPAMIDKAFERIREADLVVLQVNKATMKPDNFYGIGAQSLQLIDSIAGLKPSVLVLMTNPYLLNRIGSLDKFRAVLLGYEYLPAMLRAAGNAIVGQSGVKGRMPVGAGPFRLGSGISLSPLQAATQEQRKEDFTKRKFRLVDSIALSGITERAYPGCQVVAMKDGQVIYQKAFGKFTYARDARPVTNGTLYDLASITKIAASSLALMKLSTDSIFDYRKTLGYYLPYLQGSDKENLLIEDVLSHQAGLFPWIPFYQKFLEKNGDYRKEYFAKKKSEEFPVPVAKNLFAVQGIRDSVYRQILASRLSKQGEYVYSDLGYYFMQQIIEQQTQKPLNEFVQDLYFRLGIGLTYQPLRYHSKLQIAPTENDAKFRRQIVHGYVHDQGAAIMGGVAGHAGLFGNALEVARLMQFFLNKGELNGVRLLDSNVVKDYTSCHFCPGNRRGLCFEKPEPDLSKNSPVTADCSPESFGHSGFTGTFAWADPRNNLVVVFLSNRVYPDAEDNKLVKLGIRGNIHKAFYEALKISE